MSGRLERAPNVARPDEIYEALVALHEGRGDRESALLNAKLVLVLINHIGDEAVIREAIALVASELDQSAERPARLD